MQATKPLRGSRQREREPQPADWRDNGFMSRLEKGSSSLLQFYYPIRSDVIAIIHGSPSIFFVDRAANMNDDFKCLRLISHEIASVNMLDYQRSVVLLSLTLNKTRSNRLVAVTMFKTRVGFTVHN